MDKTTIQITKSTRDELRALEAYPKESYESIISRTMQVAKNPVAVNPESVLAEIPYNVIENHLKRRKEENEDCLKVH